MDNTAMTREKSAEKELVARRCRGPERREEADQAAAEMRAEED